MAIMLPAQPIIVSQGTFLDRNNTAEKIIQDIFSITDDSYKSHIDFKSYELEDGKKLISIEQVRDLIKEINIKPRINSKKIILISEAQSFSIEAQNALLKTLEEPPSYAQIILTVDHESNLIPTVLSRCIVRSLNLTKQIDTNTQEYTDAKNELINILNLKPEERIDWVTDNKDKIKSRDIALDLLTNWETILRGQMLENLTQKEDAITYKNKIKLLQKIKKYIESNANVALSIEALLLNI